jgi:hypothetical protein
LTTETGKTGKNKHFQTPRGKRAILQIAELSISAQAAVDRSKSEIVLRKTADSKAVSSKVKPSGPAGLAP